MEMRSINPDIGTLEPATGFVDAAAIQEFPSVLDGLCPGDGCGIFSLCSSSEAGYRQRPTVAQVERLEQIIGLRPRWWKAI
ncbi:hypothetical protein OF83DRAFT_1155201 [Amylostereum chailletii]|nr:hypothetical protein OF83DRAFT_1155201 [Amylostereum chailletii]